MAKIKISELAGELGCEAKELIAFLQEKGIEAKRSNSSIEETDADVARKRFSGNGGNSSVAAEPVKTEAPRAHAYTTDFPRSSTLENMYTRYLEASQPKPISYTQLKMMMYENYN
jgi:translation initiation factor IF-2